MIGLRSVLNAFLADRYRARAQRILAKVDRLLAKARWLKERAERLDSDGGMNGARK